MNSVQNQYERHPYPDIPWFALPKKNQGDQLRLEHGLALLDKRLDIVLDTNHIGKKILVVGGGTLESILVALKHPAAREIVMLDLSKQSINIAKKRYLLAKLIYPLKSLGKTKLAKIRFVQANLLDFSEYGFDYIIASGVLHHLQNPTAGLKHLASLLNTHGMLRMMVYPKHSRMLMHMTARFFRNHGLKASSPQLAKRCQHEISKLPKGHAIHSCFISQPETKNLSGLIDAFFHPCDNPLSPLQWKHAGFAAGLHWVSDDQNELSRSDFLIELDARCKKLSPWLQLQVMDDLLEICSNPIIWWYKSKTTPLKENFDFTPLQWASADENLDIDKAISYNIKQGLARAEMILNLAGVPLTELLEKLKIEVGPRVMATNNSVTLPGLSVLDYLESVA